MQELRLVRAALVDDDRGAGPSSKRVFGARVADVIDEKWDEIRAAAAHKLLCASGDYMLDADKYRLPPQSQRVGSQPPQLTPRIPRCRYRLPPDLTLEGACRNNHSVLWVYILVEAVHAALDDGCARMARYCRRALRRRLKRLPLLEGHPQFKLEIGADRADGLFGSLRLGWHSLLMACSGLPADVLRKQTSDMKDPTINGAGFSLAELRRRTRRRTRRTSRRCARGTPPPPRRRGRAFNHGHHAGEKGPAHMAKGHGKVSAYVAEAHATPSTTRPTSRLIRTGCTSRARKTSTRSSRRRSQRASSASSTTSASSGSTAAPSPRSTPTTRTTCTR